jgi:hypothetical protein
MRHAAVEVERYQTIYRREIRDAYLYHMLYRQYSDFTVACNSH